MKHRKKMYDIHETEFTNWSVLLVIRVTCEVSRYDFDVWLQLHTAFWQTSLQQELEDSVAQKMEEFEQVKSALQQKEEEIVSQQQTLQEKEEVIAGLNMTLNEKVKELENVSKELIDQREKSQVTKTFCL